MGTLKNITFSADAGTIERARLRAQLERTTLNDRFREWLEGYAKRRPTVEEFDKLMQRLRHVNAGRKFTRDEMNERTHAK